jgi:phosphocarrier protein
MEREFIIKNEQGIHARPATNLVQLANGFQSDLELIFNGISVDLKSIMGVLSLGVTRGSLITIRANGEDANEALSKITLFIKDINK